MRSEPYGISTKELEKETGLNHDTISRHCKDLIGKSRIKKKNKKGRYHLTDEAYGDTTIRAWLLESKLTIKLMNVVAENENAFCTVDKKYLEKYHADDLSLFKFANRIGAYITYLMIEALRPNSWDYFISGETTKGKSKLVSEWIENVIQPARLFRIFSDSLAVNKGEAVQTPTQIISFEETSKPFGLTVQTEKQKRNLPDVYLKPELKEQRFVIEEPKQWSPHELNEDNFSKLMGSFATVFPSIYQYFEATNKGLDRDIKKHMRGVTIRPIDRK